MKNMIDFPNDFNHKKVLLRVNYDVPIENGKVQDTTRIEDSLKAINWLREQNAQVILLAHYDRPEGKPVPEMSLKPVGEVLSTVLKQPVAFAEYQQNVSDVSIPTDPIVLVENLRYWDGEESNDPDFAKALAAWGEVYVDESFAVCHREHASIVGIPKLLPAFAGPSLTHEIEVLTKVRNSPEKPLIVVIGGAKVETKEPLINVFSSVADYILVGGKSAIELQGRTDLPSNVVLSDLTPDKKDITLDSAHKFANLIMGAKTVIWNGTMGVYEEPENREGTRIVAEAVNTTEAFTVMGGGDTETALTILDLEKGIDFISTGGGAMLLLLSEGTLPGIEALNHE
jgi:phosphoglycerate kinase